MKLLHYPETIKGASIALGNFDGLHAGHMAVLEKIKNRKPWGVLVFDRHTQELTEKKAPKLILDRQNMLKILESIGADFVYEMPFDNTVMKLTPGEFAGRLAEIGAERVAVGFDYHFGMNKSGDAKLLKQLGEELGFECEIAEAAYIEGILVKSTAVREYVLNGDIKTANALLGREYSVSGKVVHGLGNGKRLGFPTANIDYSNELILPPDGVYSGYAVLRDIKYPAVINIGNNPTFDAQRRTLEVHIPGIDEDMYGSSLEAYFTDRIRGEIKFGDIKELIAQIESDVKAVLSDE